MLINTGNENELLNSQTQTQSFQEEWECICSGEFRCSCARRQEERQALFPLDVRLHQQASSTQPETGENSGKSHRKGALRSSPHTSLQISSPDFSPSSSQVIKSPEISGERRALHSSTPTPPCGESLQTHLLSRSFSDQSGVSNCRRHTGDFWAIF